MGIAKQTLNLLGLRATDRVTGFTGVISSACFDLYGCIQVALTPPIKEAGAELAASHWFDVGRVLVSDDRVMAAPIFDKGDPTPATYDHGPADRPAMSRDGRRP